MGAFNILKADLTCRHCKFHGEMEIEFKFGFLNLIEYRLGDELVWIGNRKSYPKKRPQDGHYIGEGYVECPNCHKDFWVIINVVSDKIESVEVDYTREGYIVDDDSQS